MGNKHPHTSTYLNTMALRNYEKMENTTSTSNLMSSLSIFSICQVTATETKTEKTRRFLCLSKKTTTTTTTESTHIHCLKQPEQYTTDYRDEDYTVRVYSESFEGTEVPSRYDGRWKDGIGIWYPVLFLPKDKIKVYENAVTTFIENKKFERIESNKLNPFIFNTNKGLTFADLLPWEKNQMKEWTRLILSLEDLSSLENRIKELKNLPEARGSRAIYYNAWTSWYNTLAYCAREFKLTQDGGNLET